MIILFLLIHRTSDIFLRMIELDRRAIANESKDHFDTNHTQRSSRHSLIKPRTH